MEKMCGLVSNMAYKNPANKKLFAKKGVIDALEKVVEQDEPAKAVFHALSNNSQSVPSIVNIVNNGALDSLHAKMDDTNSP